MKFYTRQHKHYCGIDLHARMMYLCVLDAAGAVRLSRNIECSPKAFLATVHAFRDDLVVAAECMFTWYWLADLCQREGITFVLGHALCMRAIHGGKAKNDRINAHKIAALLRGGMIPQAQDRCALTCAAPHPSPALTGRLLQELDPDPLSGPVGGNDIVSRAWLSPCHGSTLANASAALGLDPR